MTYNIFMIPFKKYAIGLMALFIFCITYYMHKDITFIALQNAIHYQNFVDETVKDQKLNLLSNKNINNASDTKIVNDKIVELSRLILKDKNPKLLAFRQSLISSLYEMKNNSHYYLSVNTKSELSRNFEFYSFKVKKVSQDNYIYITQFLTIFLFFVLYIFLYHSLIRNSKFDLYTPFALYDSEYFTFETEVIGIQKLKNDFKVNICILSMLLTFVISIMLIPLLFVY